MMLITIEGGVVQDISTDTESERYIRVTVLDLDHLSNNSDDYARLDPGTIKNYFNNYTNKNLNK